AVGESKRANDSVEQQLKEIKKLKFSEPHKFQRKVNEDQYKFNLKLTETTDNANQPTARGRLKNCIENGCSFSVSQSILNVNSEGYKIPFFEIPTPFIKPYKT
ncbi:unnamed protein product, partial [Pocillopora meandrina]